ncbi:hypothetical protein BLNAU_20887 [Blattamonas nauphoetae]|uniref:Uncharacterized protein n=1 Tax=Blattamonas nauphoetae TaxID=2049346 RepID=A0ABQ9WY31_9EUKA|nr:hypothetical protein BLNAU_20887 [Blattamonas nauphoetae]
MPGDDPSPVSMERESEHLNKTNDASLNHSRESRSTVDTLSEPFLTFDAKSNLSFKDQSAIYCSLVALVKTNYQFDNALQDRAAQFLKNVNTKWDQDLASKFVTCLVPSSTGSPSSFVSSILTLLSSSHSTVVTATLSFLRNTFVYSSPQIQDRLVESDLVAKLLTTVQPHTLPIPVNEDIFSELLRHINRFVDHASPFYLNLLGITDTVDVFDHRELIFQKVVVPSSRFVTFLITNRYNLNGDVFNDFMDFVSTLIRIGPFHRPTMDFVLTSPIAMGFTSCLSFIEDGHALLMTLQHIDYSLREWNGEGPEVVQSAKRMIQALISKGFEDTLEQMIRKNLDGFRNYGIVEHIHCITQMLGSNVKKPRW